MDDYKQDLKDIKSMLQVGYQEHTKELVILHGEVKHLGENQTKILKIIESDQEHREHLTRQQAINTFQISELNKKINSYALSKIFAVAAAAVAVVGGIIAFINR